MPKSPATIDDAIGFDRIYKPKPVNGAPGATTGDTKFPSGNPEPERTVEGTADKIAGFDTISPFDIDNAGTDDTTERVNGSVGGSADIGTEPRRRGRPVGSRNKPKETFPPNLKGLEDILFSIHLFAASMMPEAELEKGECKEYADILRDVATYYNIAIDPKKMVLFNLYGFLGRLYIPRGIAAYKRITNKTAAKPTLVMPPQSQPAKPMPVPAEMPAPAPPPKKPVLEVPSQIWPEGGDSSYTEMAE